YSLARALHRAGKVAEGEAFRRRSIAIAEKLCDDYPKVPNYWEHLANSQGGLMYVLATTGRFKEANAEGLKAVAAFEKLAREHPTAAEFHFRVAEVCANLATAQATLGESNAAVVRK